MTELEESLSELELLEKEVVTLLVHGEGTVVDHEQCEVRSVRSVLRRGCGIDSSWLVFHPSHFEACYPHKACSMSLLILREARRCEVVEVFSYATDPNRSANCDGGPRRTIGSACDALLVVLWEVNCYLVYGNQVGDTPFEVDCPGRGTDGCVVLPPPPRHKRNFELQPDSHLLDPQQNGVCFRS